MRKLGLIVLLLAILLYGWRMYSRQEKIPKTNVKPTQVQISITPETSGKTEITSKTSLFVPYWSLEDKVNLNDPKYDTFIYFGIAADKNGVVRDDAGYQNISKFTSLVPESKSYVTLRMLDTEANLAILEDEKSQQKIIAELISIAQENNFKGVILDLEISAIPFTDVKNQINSFVSQMSSSLHENNLRFGMAIYGDAFYRARPYEVKTLGSHVDEVYVMAYDFHKSRGEPGANFPFQGKKEYGYDFQQMISDFTSNVPPDKLTITYGMYGYDWTLGPQGKPLRQAVAKSLLQMQTEFDTCEYENCSVKRDSLSGEMRVGYQDQEGYTHEVWYEDEESVMVKKDYAHEKGIGSVSYWTNGYF